MKKSVFRFIAVFSFIYVLMGMPVVYYIVHSIIDNYYQQIGRSGLAILEAISKDIHMTNADIERLKSLPYKDIPSDSVNIQIRQLFQKACDIVHARYVYLVTRLAPDEAAVHAGVADNLNVNAMFVFNIMYGSGGTPDGDASLDYEDQTKRFIYMHPDELSRYEQQLSRCFYKDSPLGEKYISSQIPFYTAEGSFAGMLGIEIYNGEYMSFVKKLKAYFIASPLAILLLALFLGITYIRNKEKSTLLEAISKKVVLDTLTGIYNRNGLEEFEKNSFLKLKEAGHSITVIMMDVDDFKNVNDNWGHGAGDEVLLGIAKIIRENVRMPEDCPIRLGGDEFMVIFTNISRKVVISVANRLMKSINTTNFLSQDITVSVSIGVSTSTTKKDNKTLSNLMKEADLALYVGKRSTKNIVVVYDESMSE